MREEEEELAGRETKQARRELPGPRGSRDASGAAVREPPPPGPGLRGGVETTWSRFCVASLALQNA